MFSWITFLLICSFAPLNHGGMHNDIPIGVQYHMHDREAIITTFEIDNMVIDCVDIYKQPTFQHPLLVNHTLQLKSNYPDKANDFATEASYPWNSSKSCPGGYIPIERIKRNGQFGDAILKVHSHNHPNSLSNNMTHEHSIIRVYNGAYYGAKASLNVWNPKLDSPSSGSIAQLWITTESPQDWLEAGWLTNEQCDQKILPTSISILRSLPPKPRVHNVTGKGLATTHFLCGGGSKLYFQSKLTPMSEVDPESFGTSEPRFSIFRTSDNYRTVGCKNLDCPGFVQTNQHAMLGAVLRPVSQYGGPQYTVDIEIFKDKITGNWWVRLQGADVGYWPKEIAPSLAKGATIIDFGGEIAFKPSGVHPKIEMGSGHFPYEGFRKASFFRNVKVLDLNYEYQTHVSIKEMTDNKGCYDVQVGKNRDGPWGLYFFYGGPGNSENCHIVN